MGFSLGEITAIGIGFGNIAAWTKLIYDAKKNGKDGNGKTCGFHAEITSRIATVETHKAELAKELLSLHTENRQDHQQIFTEIKGLSIAVATAATAAATAATAAATASQIVRGAKRRKEGAT